MTVMYVISINYKKAPLEIRERFAFPVEAQHAFLKECRERGELAESVILSTCNRMELYTQFVEEETKGEDGAREAYAVSRWERMEEAVCAARGIPMELCRRYGSCYYGEGALRHMHRVACGVDSMVMGEDEILGQVKAAYYQAMEAGCTGFALNTIFKSAITCAKRIKTDTSLSKTSVSLATLAAGRIMGFLKGREKPQVMIIGITGATGGSVMKNIRGHKEITLIGTSRRHGADGQVIGMEGAVMIPYEERYAWMGRCDVIVSATGSPHYTVSSRQWRQARERAQEAGEAPPRVLFLDLSVPADIDRQVAAYGELCQMDYFRELARSNNEKKQEAKKSAEHMIEEYLNILKKELFFHDILQEIPVMKKAAASLTFEQVLYRVRDHADYEEMKGFFGALQKVLKEG